MTVTLKEEGPGFTIRMDDNPWGFWRAVVESEPTEDGSEVRVIKIAASHPGIKPLLGEHREGLDTPLCRSVLAEIIADVTARQVVAELYRLRRNMEVFDADRLYREHYKRVSRFLPRLQRLLVGDLEAASRAMTLAPLALIESE